MTDSNKPKPGQARYAQRMQAVLDFIDSHLKQGLNLAVVAARAHFSPFHFHRQFRTFTGMRLMRLIQLLRLKQASRQLALSPEKSIAEVALDWGFDSPESFSRSFKNHLKVSPSAFRKEPDWQHWKQLFSLPTLTWSKPMDVKIVDFPETRIAALEHHGPEHQIYTSVKKFIEWRQANGISPEKGASFGLHYSDPASTLPEDYHQDIAVSVEVPIAENPQGVVNKVIPAGRCAMLRHFGSREHIPAGDYLYREWLPQSGEELRDFPFFFHYVNVGPDLKDSEMITDLYLPIK